jgi:hypothetical protein
MLLVKRVAVARFAMGTPLPNAGPAFTHRSPR